jgi:hypothetical protein
MINCWEFKNCSKKNECPAYSFELGDGFLQGKNGGRACCFVTGTFCEKTLQGLYKDKEKSCSDCEFFNILKKEHGSDFSVTRFKRYMEKKYASQFFLNTK